MQQQRWKSVAFFFAGFCLLFCMQLYAAGDNSTRQSINNQTQYAGTLKIDSMSSFGSLEMPSVEFGHDVHTLAISEGKEKCRTCHPKVNNNYIYKFKKKSVSNKKEAKNFYHKECISCHRERQDQNREYGPLEGSCRECHVQEKDSMSGFEPIYFDKSLHYRHIEATDEKCDTCHHQYDENKKQLVYKEKEELGCRACHKGDQSYPGLDSLQSEPSSALFKPEVSEKFQKDKQPMQYRQAAHLQCLNCHLEKQNESDQESGPVKCAGCHSESAQENISRIEDVPRLDRGQPNSTLMYYSAKDARKAGERVGDTNSSVGMPAVLFDHKGHEEATSDCRTCHHEHKMQQCKECHTLMGKEENNYTSMNQVGHLEQTRTSCMGCHKDITHSRKSCAGCHKFLSSTESEGQKYCGVCHLEQAPKSGELNSMDRQEIASRASKLMESKNDSTTAYKPEDIPKVVEIGVIRDQYEAVEFPHRQIYAAMLEDIQDSELAATFHREKGTLCRGCHHNSPADEDPPACASCHTKPFQENQMHRPGLKAAYHDMCMDCHTNMEIEEPANTECAKCHEKRESRIIEQGE